MFFLWPFNKNCFNSSAPVIKMATRAKNRKNLKRYLLLSQWPNFNIISQKCSSYHPLPKLLKWFRSLIKMATRAKNRKKKKNLKRYLLLSQWPNFNIISQKMFFLSPFITKIAKMVLLRWTRWLPDLKNRKNLKQLSLSSASDPISI